MSKLQSDLDREEFKKQLQVANQRKVAAHNEKESNSFSHRNGQNHSNPRNENSTELPGHDHTSTMMSKVRHRMSEIPYENEEDIRW